MLIIGSNKPSKALSVFYHIKALTSNVNESFKTSFSLSRIILITSLASQGIRFAYTVLVWHNRYSRKGSGGRISKFSLYKYNMINIKHPNCWGKISHFVHLIIKFWFNYMVKTRHYLFKLYKECNETGVCLHSSYKTPEKTLLLYIYCNISLWIYMYLQSSIIIE